MSFKGTKSPTLLDINLTKARYQLPKRKVTHGTEFYFTPELEAEFRKRFPVTSNRKMMELFGISFTTVHRFARDLHLTKNMAVIKHKQAMDVKRKCEKNGYYDKLRNGRPSEACIEATKKMFAEGFSPIKRLKEINPRKYKRLMKKKSEARKELIRKERLREVYGLMRHTNLPSHIISNRRPYTKQETHKRTWASKHGYIRGDPYSPEERYVIFYDADTPRNALYERNCAKIGMTVLPLPSTLSCDQSHNNNSYSNTESLNNIFL